MQIESAIALAGRHPAIKRSESARLCRAALPCSSEAANSGLRPLLVSPQSRGSAGNRGPTAPHPKA